MKGATRYVREPSIRMVPASFIQMYLVYNAYYGCLRRHFLIWEPRERRLSAAAPIDDFPGTCAYTVNCNEDSPDIFALLVDRLDQKKFFPFQ
jgi:hypothetical protein